MYITVQLPPDLPPRRSFIHEPKDLPVCPERVSRFDTGQPPLTLPLTLIQHPFEEGLEGTARDSLYHLGRILSYVLAVPVTESDQRFDGRIRQAKGEIGYTTMELALDHVKEEEATIAVVLIFILGFVGVVLLIKVVLWRVGVHLSGDPRQSASSSPLTSVSTSIGMV